MISRAGGNPVNVTLGQNEYYVCFQSSNLKCSPDLKDFIACSKIIFAFLVLPTWKCFNQDFLHGNCVNSTKESQRPKV